MLDTDEKYMKEELEAQKKADKSKWLFEDYVFAATGIIVGVGYFLLAYGAVNEGYQDYGFLDDMIENIEAGRGINIRDYRQWLPFSGFLFLLAWAICEYQVSFVAYREDKKDGSFGEALADALYITVTFVLLVIGVVTGVWYASWLASPLMWIGTIIVLKIAKKDENEGDVIEGDCKEPIPGKALFLAIFFIGIVVEVFTRAWLAFPLAWTAICALKVINIWRRGNLNESRVFELLYYFAGFVLLVVGISLGIWATSWLALPVVYGISKIYGVITKHKTKAHVPLS